MKEPVDETFRAQLEARITTYREQSERIRTRLTELNHDLVDLERRVEAAEELYRREYGATPPGSSPSRGRRQSVPASGGRPSWREAIISVLQTRKQPMHVKEIWQALLDTGFKTDSRDPLRSIVSIAVRDPSIHRIAPNTYSLNGGTAAQMQLDGRGGTVPTEEEGK